MTDSVRVPSALAIRLFGPLELLLHGTPLPRLRSRKGHWLLALLVLRQRAEVERPWLAGLLWSDSSASEAYASLRVSLTHLRSALGPEAGRLRSPTLHTLSLDLEGAEVDVTAFDAAIARGDVTSLEQAIALYRGPLLEGCAEEWAFQERQVREQAYLQALETLAGGAMTRGDPAAAAGYLGRVTAVDPLRESAQRGRMQALAAAGNYAAALLSYRELRLRLHRDLNAEPDPETQALFQQLRAEARGEAGARGRGSGAGKASHAGAVDLVSARTDPRPTAHFVGTRPLRGYPPGPSGTVTFFLTDVEGSTEHWLQHPEAMRHALARHDALAAALIEQHDGLLVKQRGEGDSLFAVFARATDAVAAALAFQRALTKETGAQVFRGSGVRDDPPEPLNARTPERLKVRVALHTGEAERREGDYYGLAVNHCARLRAVGHGGQTVLSQTTAALVRDDLPADAGLRELGVHRLKDLQRPEPIFQLVHPDLPVAFPPLRSLEAFAHNLPVQLTSFIGREREMAEVKRLFPTTHLLTLTGAGGCGKTRLALQMAADLLEEYGDGVWLVELAAISDPGLVPQTVASALGVREEPNRPLTATLTNTLRARSLVLVLDNCEHLLSACAGLAETLLQRCANLRLLATSREGLRLAGETTYRVPPLSLPAGGGVGGWGLGVGEGDCGPNAQPPTPNPLLQSEAAQLFVERAMAAAPSFMLNDQNAAAVAQVCCQLDGIPLAIELAAARVKALPVEKIAERLIDRFRLLTGGSRTALPRHQTLQALIDWSYELLAGPERVLLRRVSVFAGGWTLEAAEAVCAGEGIEAWEVIDLLTSLVEKSLVGYEEQAGEARYRLLETIRQYGRERLREGGEGEVVRGGHRDWFLALAEQAAPELRGPWQGEWLERLEGEHDNLRSALEWCRAEATGAETELRLAGALVWFWIKRSYLREGRQCLEAALSRNTEAPSSLRLRALLGAGRLATLGGDSAGVSFLQASLDLARATGDPEGMAMALSVLGMQVAYSNDSEQAVALAEESLIKAREAGDPWLIAFCLQALGFVVRMRGDRERATTLYRDSLVLMRQVGDKWMMVHVLVNLGAMAQARGDDEPARSAYQEGLALSQELKDRRGMAWCLESLAEVAAVQGQSQRGARLMGAAERLLEAIGASWPPNYVAGRERALAAIRTALGDEPAAVAVAEGRAMTPDVAVAYALEEAAAG